MIPVAEAVARIVGAFSPLAAETIGLEGARARVLAEDVVARVTQPPFSVSAMDGYAVRGADVATAPVTLREIGRVPAGQRFEGPVGPGETVRIFTGARLPDDTDTIVIQENVDADGGAITVREATPAGRYVRAAGLDFNAGDVGLAAGRRLDARAIGLAAAMNVPWLRVRRRPRIAILGTGDEIVMPGDPRGENQIVSSNSLALQAFVEAHGGEAINLGIAADNRESLRRLAAGAAGADLLVTTGGASVGEHDLVRSVLGEAGLTLDFWKIAMRPGKPLMFGQIGETRLLGLPGNPVSSLVCAIIFLRPAIGRMLGRVGDGNIRLKAVLGADLAANDEREDYLRATLQRAPDGRLIATPFPKQDSSMLSLLAQAQCLVVRPPFAAPAKRGETVEMLKLDVDGDTDFS